MGVLHNDLLSAYKLAKPCIKHSDVDKYVKEYFDTIKKKPSAAELGNSKSTEWKRLYLKR